ncbi:MAG: hypothetical protein ACI88L_000482 [Candidatus Paceibacteria bacterium]|jgi:hypothetical protein
MRYAIAVIISMFLISCTQEKKNNVISDQESNNFPELLVGGMRGLGQSFSGIAEVGAKKIDFAVCTNRDGGMFLKMSEFPGPEFMNHLYDQLDEEILNHKSLEESDRIWGNTLTIFSDGKCLSVIGSTDSIKQQLRQFYSLLASMDKAEWKTSSIKTHPEQKRILMVTYN